MKIHIRGLNSRFEVYRTLHPTKKNTHFSCVCVTFSIINHIEGHKDKFLNKLKEHKS